MKPLQLIPLTMRTIRKLNNRSLQVDVVLLPSTSANLWFSFCGIMFDLRAKATLPVEYVEVHSVWVRGELGPVSVYYTNGSHEDKFDKPDEWTKVFEATMPESWNFTQLRLRHPIRINSGESIGLYIHSTAEHDSAIVYDNARDNVSHEDLFIRLESGLAHVSSVAFQNRFAWGWAWRPRREFVGRISQGVRYLLWRPLKEVHFRFPENFRDAVHTLLLVSNRPGSLLNSISVDILYYIINMCKWDWFGPLKAHETTRIKTADDRDGETDENSTWRGNGFYRDLIYAHAMTRVQDEDSDSDSDYEE